MKTWMTAMMLMVALLVTTGEARADYLPEGATQAEQIDSIDRMEAYLASEAFVLSRLDLRKHSDDAVLDLATIAQSGSYKAKLRTRAIQSLALYAREDMRAQSALAGLMRTVKPGQQLFPVVLLSFGEALGEDAALEVAQYATHKREDVRMAAVVALGRFGGQTGYDVLTQLIEQETSEAIIARIHEYVR
jgi:HEAT repeat protein